MTKTIIAAAVAAVLFAAGCGGDDTPKPVEQDQAAEQSEVDVPDPLGNCDELAGLATSEIVEVGLCADDDTEQILASANYECGDGTKLHWNDFGWGYSDGDWQSHDRDDGQLVPPQNEIDSCRG